MESGVAIWVLVALALIALLTLEFVVVVRMRRGEHVPERAVPRAERPVQDKHNENVSPFLLR